MHFTLIFSSGHNQSKEEAKLNGGISGGASRAANSPKREPIFRFNPKTVMNVPDSCDSESEETLFILGGH